MHLELLLRDVRVNAASDQKEEICILGFIELFFSGCVLRGKQK
jgi:hypothetical protein